MKTIFFRSVLLSLLFFVVGCAKPPHQSKPEDTIMGSSSSRRSDYVPSTKGYSSGDYIDETLIYTGSANDEPLVPRSSNTSAYSSQAKSVAASVYFGFDRSNIDAQERAKLLKIADELNKNSQMSVLVKGHCDYFGTKEYNLALGERRAMSAKRYLEQLGVASSRIETVSMGNLDAQYRGTKAEVAQDRRDDIYIVQ